MGNVIDETAEARIREIQALFVEKGWRLRVYEEDNGTWFGVFHLGPIHGENPLTSARLPQEVTAKSAVAAAEAAWAKYEREPWLGGGSNPTE
jgi:hypothetical protein